jgi:hypothetical protein
MAALCESVVNVVIMLLVIQAVLLWPVLPAVLLDTPTGEVTVEIDLPAPR